MMKKVTVEITSAATKISGDALKELSDAIEKSFRAFSKEYGFESFTDMVSYMKDNTKAKDPNKRARWDLYWNTPLKWRHDWNDRILGDGVTMDHVDTALRNIVKKL